MSMILSGSHTIPRKLQCSTIHCKKRGGASVHKKTAAKCGGRASDFSRDQALALKRAPRRLNTTYGPLNQLSAASFARHGVARAASRSGDDKASVEAR